MTSKLVKIEIECPSCSGTGLYSGFAEGAGCAVICHQCSGTGKSSYSYRPFTGRKLKKGILKVYRSGCGYGSSATGEMFDLAGCSYKQWQEGKRPAPAKRIYCPYLWTGQDMQLERHKAYKMYKAFCGKVLRMTGSISDCPLYNSKDQCWDEYEKVAKDWD